MSTTNEHHEQSVRRWKQNRTNLLGRLRQDRAFPAHGAHPEASTECAPFGHFALPVAQRRCLRQWGWVPGGGWITFSSVDPALTLAISNQIPISCQRARSLVVIVCGRRSSARGGDLRRGQVEQCCGGHARGFVAGTPFGRGCPAHACCIHYVGTRMRSLHVSPVTSSDAREELVVDIFPFVPLRGMCD